MAPGFWVSRPPVQEFHDSFQLDDIGQTVQKEHLNAPYRVFTGLGVVDGVSVTILGNPAPMTIVVGNTGFEDVPYGRPMA
ncbi:hypothetical protein ACHAO1_009198 [Botrytis cinerea]